VPNRKPDSDDPIYQAKERYKNALNSLINLIAQGDNDSIIKLLEFLRKQDTIHEAVQEVLQLKFLPE
jgi:prephenate dehydrogenase